MSKRLPAVLVAALALVATVSPVVGQDGSPAPSPLSSASPAVSPGASPLPVLPESTPINAGPRLRQAVSPLLHRSGMLDHAVTLGDELIALAPTVDRRGQTVIRVLATGDGTIWTKRGRIPLTGDVTDLLADGTSLYAAGWDEGATIWRSDDAGRTWTAPADPAPFAGGADGLPSTDESADIAAMTRGPAGLLAVGQATEPDTLERRAAAWRSADGLTWERLVDVATLPPFHALAADAATYVVIGSSLTTPRAPLGGDVPVVRWSEDGAAWTDATIEIGALESIDGVIAVPSGGFLAWGRHLDSANLPAITWSSPDGRTWARSAPDASLLGARLAQVRAVEGGSLLIGVGGASNGAWVFTEVGGTWRRRVIRANVRFCARDVASVRAIVVVVGGTCGDPRQRGRAWTAPLEP